MQSCPKYTHSYFALSVGLIKRIIEVFAETCWMSDNTRIGETIRESRNTCFRTRFGRCDKGKVPEERYDKGNTAKMRDSDQIHQLKLIFRYLRKTGKCEWNGNAGAFVLGIKKILKIVALLLTK